MITMYGIPNCDTIKKAKKYLTQHNIDYTFHDYRKDGVSEDLVTHFCNSLDWEKVLNKRGTTYRALSDEVKSKLDKATAIEQLIESPAMIKRPILDIDGVLHLGFKAAQYDEIFKK